MKPAPFDYHAPLTVGEAAELLSTLDDAKLLAGGQSLIPLLALRLTRFQHLIDLGGVHELRGIDRTDGVVTIGAMTTDAEIEASEVVSGGVAPRGQGHAAHRPFSDSQPRHGRRLPCPCRPCRGVSGRGRGPGRNHGRVERVTDRGGCPPRTSSSPPSQPPWPTDEILTSVEFPIWPGAAGFGAYEVARRHGDFAIVGAMTGVQLDGSQVVKAAVALFGVAGRPHRAGAAEAALVGSSADTADLGEVGRLAAADLDPPSDIHASSSYRRQVAAVAVERALSAAFLDARARG